MSCAIRGCGVSGNLQQYIFENPPDAAVQTFGEKGERAIYVVADVADPAQVESILHVAIHAFGQSSFVTPRSLHWELSFLHRLSGRIVAFPEVGGLHHRYERRAA